MNIIVEGNTDKYFLEIYCKYLKINANIESIGGKNKLKNYKKLNNDTKYFLIIFDADNDFNSSKENIKNQIKELENKSKNYSIFLFPNNNDKGNLEILIENIAKHKEILSCFEQYIKCIENIKNHNKNILLPPKKSKVFAYMSSFGFKNGVDSKDFNFSRYVDFEDDYLKPLKEFLLNHKNN